MNKFGRIVTGHPKTVVAAVLVLTVVFAFAAVQINRRADLSANLPQSEPRMAAFNDFRAKYDSGNSLLVVLTGRDVFAPASLSAVDDITRALLHLEGVRRVISLTNLTEFRGSDETLGSGPLIESPPATAAESAALRAKIMADSWYRGRLVSEDGRSTLVLITLDAYDDMAAGTAKLNEIRELVDARGGGLSADYAGSVVMDEQIDRFLGKDIVLLFPLVLLAVAFVLFLAFRNLRGIFLPLVTVIISVIWTIGLMALAKHPLSLVSNIIPVLLIGIGSAYGIHIVARTEEGLREGLDRRQAVAAAVEHSGSAVWLAALTTMAGFGSLALSKMAMLFDFGVFSAFGVAAALLVSLTFIPALLVLLPVPASSRRGRGNTVNGRVSRWVGRLVSASTRHYIFVLVAVILVAAASLLGWPRLKTTFDLAEFLPAGSSHRRTEALVNEKFGGSAALEILIGGDLSDPELLRRVESLQNAMEKEGMGRPISIVNLLARINRAFNDDDPAAEVLPDDPDLIAQYLLLLSISATPDELAEYISFDMREARISLRISNVMPTERLIDLISAVEERAAAALGADTPVTITGTPVIRLAMMDIIRNEQMKNIVSSLLAILILVWLAFRSLPVGLGCVAPIALTILYDFGLMGWAGIPLNCATATMAGLATGIGIDYSIHFYRRYLEERRSGLAAAAAIEAAGETAGGTIVANAFAVGAGFAVLLWSRLALFRSFGALVALTMLATAFGALTVLPALIGLRAGVRRRRTAGNREVEG